MSEYKYVIRQKGVELQEILDRNVYLSETEYEELKNNNLLDEKKVYFVFEDE